MYCFKGGFNMKKKLVGALLVTAMVATTLAGCGNSNTTASTPASTDAAETTESAAESVAEVESRNGNKQYRRADGKTDISVVQHAAENVAHKARTRNDHGIRDLRRNVFEVVATRTCGGKYRRVRNGRDVVAAYSTRKNRGDNERELLKAVVG